MSATSSDVAARRILVVDDSAATREILCRNLEAEGYTVTTAGSVADALKALEAGNLDLVVTDVRMPGTSGLDLVRHVRENLRDVEVTVITGYPDVGGAISAMKYGATDYLTKPFTDEELLQAVRRALQRLDDRRAQGVGASPAVARHGLLGDSPAMESVRGLIERASRVRATVLISGESGTGKELVARAIHYESRWASAPFVPVNCCAIPRELLESELFGHVKGAFTGATEARAGFFLTADGGTIFLDELGDTGPEMQSKLLRVLQDKQVRMVGSSRARSVNVRIIAATNKGLERLVRQASFREDLYFRVNVIPIPLPALRERGSDVVLLAHHFAERFAGEFGRPAPTFSDRVLDIFRAYSWPGNVRELENLVQRLVVMLDGQHIDVPDLPMLMRFSAPTASGGVDRSLAEVEAEHIARVLESVGGNKSRAARILGIDRKSLRAKLARADAGDREDSQ